MNQQGLLDPAHVPSHGHGYRRHRHACGEDRTDTSAFANSAAMCDDMGRRFVRHYGASSVIQTGPRCPHASRQRMTAHTRRPILKWQMYT